MEVRHGMRITRAQMKRSVCSLPLRRQSDSFNTIYALTNPSAEGRLCRTFGCSERWMRKIQIPATNTKDSGVFQVSGVPLAHHNFAVMTQ
jgi:hypothetical protein